MENCQQKRKRKRRISNSSNGRKLEENPIIKDVSSTTKDVI